jgi:Spy/CpxP family protein refolding chaperone
MNTLRKSIIIGLTVLGLGGTTLAVQAHDGRGHAAKHEQMKANWGERAAKREQKLHDALKLTPNQEAAWATYTSAIKPAARTERGERGDWKNMAAPERMAKRIEMAKQRVAVMESRLQAVSAFYAVLTPEQKKLFDDNSTQRGHRMGHRMKEGMQS